MEPGVATQQQSAQAGEGAGSAPVEPGQKQPQPAGTAESAPASGTEGANISQTPAEPGPEPGEDSKAVRELKQQRRARQEAEERETYWRGVAEGRIKPEPQAQQQLSTVPGEPKLEDFENWEEYQKSFSQFQWDQMQALEKRKMVEIEYSRRLAEAEKKQPGLTEKINAGQFPSNPEILHAIRDSEAGPMIAGYLADNSTESIKLSRMPVAKALIEIGKMEMKLSGPITGQQQPRQVTQAPVPFTPTKAGGSGLHKSVEEMSTEEFIAHRNAQEFDNS